MEESEGVSEVAGHPTPSLVMRCVGIIPPAFVIAWVSLIFWNSAKPLPPGTHVVSQVSRLSEADVEFLTESPQSPNVASRDAAAIDHAEQLIVIDRSPVTRELAQRLLARKRLRPGIKIVLVTDPANQVFGGTPAATLASLEQAGVIVARVQLDRLRDSNPLYSGVWRLLIGWWSNPFDEAPGNVSLRVWLRMQNFKSNQRQLLVADDGSAGWSAIIAPTDAVAGLVFKGSVARAMIASELQIVKWSTDDDRLPAATPMEGGGLGSIDARFLTEGGIKTALLDAVAAAGTGDRISIAVEVLSHRPLITAAIAAAWRGVRLRVLLSRDRIPNRTVADELLREGAGRIEVRWFADEPAVPRLSLLAVRHRSDLWLNFGAANFTRRNLDDLNLEAGVELRMPLRAAPARAVAEYFDGHWSRAAVYPRVADEGSAAYWRYRFAEATGLSSF
ncbi:MAG: phospholipase D-like domain-containing protein [Gammaproteobacteria bacterium]